MSGSKSLNQNEFTYVLLLVKLAVVLQNNQNTCMFYATRITDTDNYLNRNGRKSLLQLTCFVTTPDLTFCCQHYRWSHSRWKFVKSQLQECLTTANSDGYFTSTKHSTWEHARLIMHDDDFINLHIHIVWARMVLISESNNEGRICKTCSSREEKSQNWDSV